MVNGQDWHFEKCDLQTFWWRGFCTLHRSSLSGHMVPCGITEWCSCHQVTSKNEVLWCLFARLLTMRAQHERVISAQCTFTADILILISDRNTMITLSKSGGHAISKNQENDLKKALGLAGRKKYFPKFPQKIFPKKISRKSKKGWLSWRLAPPYLYPPSLSAQRSWHSSKWADEI